MFINLTSKSLQFGPGVVNAVWMHTIVFQVSIANRTCGETDLHTLQGVNCVPAWFTLVQDDYPMQALSYT